MENNNLGNNPNQPQPTGPQPGEQQPAQPQFQQPLPNQPEQQQPPQHNFNPQPQQQSMPTQQPQQAYQQPQQQAQAHQTDTLGITSLVLAFIAPIIGLIVGFIGKSKAKKGGYSGTLSLVGIIINAVFFVFGSLIFVTLILSNFQGAQSKGRDTVATSNTNSVYQKLEEFYNTNAYYPEELKLEDFPGIDQSSFNAVVSDPAYTYVASDCVQNRCDSYVIGVQLESTNSRGEDFYQKTSLN